MNDIFSEDMVDKGYIIIEAERPPPKLFDEIVASIGSERFQNLRGSFSSVGGKRVPGDKNCEELLHWAIDVSLMYNSCKI